MTYQPGNITCFIRNLDKYGTVIIKFSEYMYDIQSGFNINLIHEILKIKIIPSEDSLYYESEN